MVLFTCNVKKVKGAAHKNVDVDGSCKQLLRPSAEHVANGIKCARIKDRGGGVGSGQIDHYFTLFWVVLTKRE